MKKLLFSACSLGLGGIETSLVTLLNYLANKDYKITLVLEKKEGVFLEKISPKIEIIEYKPCNSKNIIKRKIINLLKRIKFIIQYKNKYDFAASFATYSIPGSFVARTASKNTALWGHADYYTLFNNNEEEMKKFFIERRYNEFRHIIFVSEEGRKSFIKLFPEMKEKAFTCNNMINAKEIIKKSEEKIEDAKKENITTFLNIGRHDERQKKLTRIIEAAKKLKEENEEFRIIFIGDGQDSNLYKQKVKEYNLQDKITFLGKKKNPYPYFNISDCVILSSDYEGYPVVYLESFVLQKPLITTDVSDYNKVEGRGIVTKKETESIYKAMKEFIKKGYKITNKFDYEKYNNEISKKLEKIF